MLAVENLYQVSQQISVATKKYKHEDAFSKLKSGNSMIEGLQFFLSLIDEALSEVESCQFRRDDKQKRFLLELKNFRAKFLETLALRDRGSVGSFFPPGDVERLGAIAEAVTEVLDGEGKPLDRSAFADATAKLISEVRDWSIGEYEKRSLLLSLNLVVSQSNAAATSFSDTEIRRRIKMVVAEFAVEFVVLDKEFEKWFETLKRWARLGYEGAPTPLGLTSKVAQVAGLLPKP